MNAISSATISSDLDQSLLHFRWAGTFNGKFLSEAAKMACCGRWSSVFPKSCDELSNSLPQRKQKSNFCTSRACFWFVIVAICHHMFNDSVFPDLTPIVTKRFGITCCDLPNRSGSQCCCCAFGCTVFSATRVPGAGG